MTQTVKRNITGLIVLFAAITTTFSQVNIEREDFPLPGEVFTLYFDTLPPANLGIPADTAQTWHFDSLSVHLFKTAKYSSVLPYHYYRDAFPDANLFTYGPSYFFSGLFGSAPVGLGLWGYMYWRADTTGFRVVGFRGNFGDSTYNVVEKPSEMLMGAPASYDSVFKDTSRWQITFTEDSAGLEVVTSFSRQVNKSLVCDAFGEITTPFGTYDVLRVHETSYSTDSLIVRVLGIPVVQEENKDTVQNYHFWADSIGYPLIMIYMENDSTILMAEYLAGVDNAYPISGTVYSTNGITPISSGKVDLIARDAWDHLFGIPESVPLDDSGHFQFSSVTGGNWLVLADPDTSAYPYNIPTYYGDSLRWKEAEMLTVTKDTHIVINTQNDSAYAFIPGSGTLSGIIYRDSSEAKSTAHAVESENVKVALESNPGGTVKRHSKSKEGGVFNFGDVPEGNYTIRVEIAGLAMDTTYEMYVADTGDTFSNLNFIYDSTHIYIFENTHVVNHHNKQNFRCVVYPNPFKNYITLRTNFKPENTREYTAHFRDITGRTVYSRKGMFTGSKANIDTRKLENGFYILEIEINDEQIFSSAIIKTS